MPRTAAAYWLMKVEPSAYSIDDLARDLVTSWEGVRNYQARNFMRDGMKKGDLVLFYASNADPSGVAGVARIEREAYPDPTAFDSDSDYFDPKSKRENPTWVAVDLAFVEKLPGIVSLEQLKATPALSGMRVVQRGDRLSVQPVSAAEFKTILRLARQKH